MPRRPRYDPYVPRAGSSNGGAAGAGGESGPRPNDKVERLKDGLREAQDVMKDNIDAVLRRGETLENLQGKTGESSSSISFTLDSRGFLLLWLVKGRVSYSQSPDITWHGECLV